MNSELRMSYLTVKFYVIIDFVYIHSAIISNNKDESPGISNIFLLIQQLFICMELLNSTYAGLGI